MNYKRDYRPLNKVAGLAEPPDGYTDEERELIKLLTTHSIQDLYGKLPTARMKLIVALHFELRYPQELVAEMVGMKQPSLIDEIAVIQRVLLGKPYKPRQKKVTLKAEDLFRVLLAMQSSAA